MASDDVTDETDESAARGEHTQNDRAGPRIGRALRREQDRITPCHVGQPVASEAAGEPLVDPLEHTNQRRIRRRTGRPSDARDHRHYLVTDRQPSITRTAYRDA